MAKGRKIDYTKKHDTKKKRSVSFSKRRCGFFNKGAELCTLCYAQIALLVSSPSSKPNRKIYSFGYPSVDFVCNSFLGNFVPNNNAIDHNEKQCALSLFNEIKGLDCEINDACVPRNKKMENLANGFSSIFDCFQESESVEELDAVVDTLKKFINEAKARVSNNSISCFPRNVGDLGSNGFGFQNQMDYVSCCDVKDIASTSKTNGDDLVTNTLQDSAFGYNFNSYSAFPMSTNPVDNNYNDSKGKQIDCNIFSTNNESSSNFGVKNYCYNEASSGFNAMKTDYNANQNVPAAIDCEDLLDWLS